MHEALLGKLQREAEELASSLADLRKAAISPFVEELGLHAAVVRRCAACERQYVELNMAVSRERKAAVGARIRERLSTRLREDLRNREIRIQAESESLELISLKLTASFRQGGTD
jgi:hypothetical protein